ncbi:MAG: hypothetical protein RLP14_05935 [Owenweeksia sp.]
MIGIDNKIKYLKGSTGTLRRTVRFQIDGKQREAQQYLLDRLLSLYSFYRNLSRQGNGVQSLLNRAENGRNAVYMPLEPIDESTDFIRTYFQSLSLALKNEKDAFRISEARTLESILHDLDLIASGGFGSPARFLRFARIGKQDHTKTLFH